MLQYYIIYYLTCRPDIMKTNWKLPPFYDLTFLIFNNRKHPGKGVKDILDSISISWDLDVKHVLHRVFLA